MRTMVPRLTHSISLNEFEDSAILQLSSREYNLYEITNSELYIVTYLISSLSLSEKWRTNIAKKGFFFKKLKSLELLGVTLRPLNPIPYNIKINRKDIRKPYQG